MREDLSDNQYICSSQRYRNSFCGNRGINIPKLNNIVWNSFLSLPKDLTKLNDPENNKRLRKLRKDIESNEIRKKQNTQEINRLISIFKPDEDGFQYTKISINNLVGRNKVIDKKLTLLYKEKDLFYQEDELIKRLDTQIKSLQSGDSISEIEKQKILRNFVRQVDIMWNNEIRNHIVTVDFSYDKNSDFFFEKVIKIRYVKSGWRFDETDVSYEFHKKVPRIETKRINGKFVDGEIHKSSLDVKLISKDSKNKFGT
jgi:hypothetical protein